MARHSQAWVPPSVSFSGDRVLVSLHTAAGVREPPTGAQVRDALDRTWTRAGSVWINDDDVMTDWPSLVAERGPITAAVDV